MNVEIDSSHAYADVKHHKVGVGGGVWGGGQHSSVGRKGLEPVFPLFGRSYIV